MAPPSDPQDLAHSRLSCKQQPLRSGTFKDLDGLTASSKIDAIRRLLDRDIEDFEAIAPPFKHLENLHQGDFDPTIPHPYDLIGVTSADFKRGL